MEQTQNQIENQATIADPNIITVAFDTGIKKGAQTITEITIHKPKTRALRGLSLVNLLQMDVESIAKAASRITVPTLSENDVYELDPADFTKLGTGIIGFFVNTKDDSQPA